jgi:hypothetical protein
MLLGSLLIPSAVGRISKQAAVADTRPKKACKSWLLPMESTPRLTRSRRRSRVSRKTLFQSQQQDEFLDGMKICVNEWGLTRFFLSDLSLAFRFSRHTVTATVISLIVT